MGKGASSEGPERWAEQEIVRIIMRLASSYWSYFDKREVLNSDGMRLLSSALRYARYVREPVRRRLKEALRKRDLRSLEALAEELGLQDVPDLFMGPQQGLEGWKEQVL